MVNRQSRIGAPLGRCCVDSIPRVIQRDPDILGGTPVFAGTRVPVKTLLDYLEAGDSLNGFLDHFPSVSREQAVAALELAREILIAHADTAR